MHEEYLVSDVSNGDIHTKRQHAHWMVLSLKLKHCVLPSALMQSTELQSFEAPAPSQSIVLGQTDSCVPSPLSSVIPAVEAWLEQEQELLCNVPCELTHEPVQYEPSTKAEQLEELLTQASSFRCCSPLPNLS